MSDYLLSLQDNRKISLIEIKDNILASYKRNKIDESNNKEKRI